jgi:hypothetical protein
MEYETHFPPGSEGAQAAEEVAKAAADAEAKAAQDATAAETATADEAKAKEAEVAAAAEAEAKAKADEEAEKLTKKPRSIYDDLKDEKGRRKSAEEIAAAETARADAAEAELAKVRDGKKPDDVLPPKDEKPLDELETFAKEQELDPAALTRLAEIIAKKIPASQLTEAEKQDLADLRTFKNTQESRDRIAAEDAAILASASAVKQQLEIHDDAELGTVMKEITRLAHTKPYADKELDYILFKEKATLAKLVSPKKASFEAGGDQGDAPAETPLDLSSGKVTPEQMQRANQGHSKSALEIRKAV